MWKNVVVLVLAIGLSSCGAKRKGVEASNESKKIVLGEIQSISYKSLGNGVASISLELFENQTFKFDFKSIPQPGSDEKAIQISEKGTYTTSGNWKTLNFREPKFSLGAIFDTQFSDPSHFEVIDVETVRINTTKNALPIWGVVCEKQ